MKICDELKKLGGMCNIMNFSIGNLMEKVFDSFKKITPALIAIALFTGMLLFLPEYMLKRMSLADLPVMWRQIIGITFLLSIALIITLLISAIFRSFILRWKKKKQKANLKKKYVKLSPNQKDIILRMLQSDEKSVLLDSNSGDTIYLEKNLFLHRPQQFVTLGGER